MDCIIKIWAKVCCVITALFDVRPGNPVPLLYAIYIKTVESIKHPGFIKWHTDISNRVPQLPYIFLNMLHKVLSQLASFFTNSVNNSLVKHGDNGAKLTLTLVSKILKFVSRFFNNIENHIMEGSFLDSVPTFTPRYANPILLHIANVIAPINKIAALKVKPDALPPGTPACETATKKQKIKPAAGSKDFTTASLFCCKEGTQIGELFPSDLTKKYHSFLRFHDKKCSKPSQAWDFNHVGKWDKIPVDDQSKILEHFHAFKGKIWLDADTFAKHRATVPNKFTYLLGDSKGPKSA